MFSKYAFAAASLATVVCGHQNFHQFWVNDVSPGYQVAIRMPPSNSPVTDVLSDDIACNVNGSVVPSSVGVATANEGDSIKVQWDSSSHPGPIQHYLFGPVASAADATGIGAGWVKIDDFNSLNGTWANAVMEAQNMTYTFKLPTGLASGDYLLRSEMLALHGAQTLGGAQVYIGCAQLTITGTGSGDNACTPSVSLPGAYNETDPGIYIPNIYNGFNISEYIAPGGDVAVCGSGSGSGTASSPATNVATSAPSVATSAAVVPSSSAVSSAAALTTLQTLTSSSVPAAATSAAAAEGSDDCE